MELPKQTSSDLTSFEPLSPETEEPASPFFFSRIFRGLVGTEDGGNTSPSFFRRGSNPNVGATASVKAGGPAAEHSGSASGRATGQPTSEAMSGKLRAATALEKKAAGSHQSQRPVSLQHHPAPSRAQPGEKRSESHQPSASRSSAAAPTTAGVAGSSHRKHADVAAPAARQPTSSGVTALRTQSHASNAHVPVAHPVASHSQGRVPTAKQSRVSSTQSISALAQRGTDGGGGDSRPSRISGTMASSAGYDAADSRPPRYSKRSTSGDAVTASRSVDDVTTGQRSQPGDQQRGMPPPSFYSSPPQAGSEVSKAEPRSAVFDNPERQKTTEEVFGSSVRVRRQESGAKRSLSGVPSSSSVGTKTSDSAVPGSVSQSTAEDEASRNLLDTVRTFMILEARSSDASADHPLDATPQQLQSSGVTAGAKPQQRHVSAVHPPMHQSAADRSLYTVLKRLGSIIEGPTTVGDGVPLQDAHLKQYWMPDEHCKSCYECGATFHTFRRRHHCRVCGQIFCWRCCSEAIPAQNMGLHAALGALRVCTYCAKVIHNYSVKPASSDDINSFFTSRSSDGRPSSQSKSTVEPGASPAPLSRHGSILSQYALSNAGLAGSGSNTGASLTGSMSGSVAGNMFSGTHDPRASFSGAPVMPSRGSSQMHHAGSSQTGSPTGKFPSHDITNNLREIWLDLVSEQRGLGLQTHRYRLRSYAGTMVGSVIVDWFINKEFAANRNMALSIGQALLDSHRIEPAVSEDHIFKDEFILYKVGPLGQVEIENSQVPVADLTDDLDEAEPRWFQTLAKRRNIQPLPLKLSSPPRTEPRRQPEFAGTRKLSASARSASFTSDSRAISDPFLPTESPGSPSDDRTHPLLPPTTPSQRYMLSSLRTGSIAAHGDLRSLFQQLDSNDSMDEGRFRSASAVPEESFRETFSKQRFTHLRKLLQQQLTLHGLSHHWMETIMRLAVSVSENVLPNQENCDQMSARDYTQFKKVPGGTREECQVVWGVICTKNVIHRSMLTSLRSPTVMLLKSALEYQRVENKYSSIETLVMQEREFLKKHVNRIVAHRPNILLVEKSVARHAQDLLLHHGVTVVTNVKPSVMGRIARLCHASQLSSVDHLNRPYTLGACDAFHLKTFRLEHGREKTLMFFEGCPHHLGCAVVLRGGSAAELAKVKCVTKFMVHIGFSSHLEEELVMNLWAAPQWQTEARRTDSKETERPRTPPTTPPSQMFLCEMRNLMLPDEPDVVEMPSIQSLPETSEITPMGSVPRDLVPPIAEQCAVECVSPIRDTHEAVSRMMSTEASVSSTSVPVSPELLEGIHGRTSRQLRLHAYHLWEQFSEALEERVLSSSPWVAIHQPHINLPGSEVPSPIFSSPGSSQRPTTASKRSLSRCSLTNTYPHVGYWSRTPGERDGFNNSDLPVKEKLMRESAVIATKQGGFVVSCPCLSDTRKKGNSALSSSGRYQVRLAPRDAIADLKDSVSFYINPPGVGIVESGIIDSEYKLARLSSRFESQELCHPLSSTLLLHPAPVRTIKSVVSHFRAFGALGGRQGGPCMGQPPSDGPAFLDSRTSNTLDQPSSSATGDSTSEANPNIEAFSSSQKRDCLDPRNHQQITVCFSTTSAVSPNSPEPCILPWIVNMEFFGKNDVCLGEFLRRYCFRENYLCVNTMCGLPMLQHARHFVHGNATVHIRVEMNPHPLPEHTNENAIFGFSSCTQCSRTTMPLMMSVKSLSYSLGKFLELLFYAEAGGRNDGVTNCNHSVFHDNILYFGCKNLVATFEYGTIVLLEVVIPPIIISRTGYYQETTKWSEEFDMLMGKINFVYRSLAERLEELEQSVAADVNLYEVPVLRGTCTIEQQDFVDKLAALREEAVSVGIIRKRVMSMSVIRPRSQLASRGLSPADVQMTEGSLCDSLNLLRSSLCSRTRFWNQSLLEIFRSERHRRAQSKNTAPGKPKATPQQQQQQQPNIAKKVSKELPLQIQPDIAVATQANITADTLSRSEECLAIHSDYFADGGPRTRGGELSRSTSTEMVCTSPGEVPMPALSALLQRARSRSAPVMALEYTASSVEVLPIPGVTDVTNSTATSASSSPLGSDWVDLKKSELPPGVEEAGAVPVASGGGRWLQAGPSLSRQDSTSSQRQIPNPASPILSDGRPQKRLSGISNPPSSRTSPVSSPRPDHRPLTDAVQRLAVMAAPRTASPALSGDGKLDMSRLSTGAVDSPLFKRIKDSSSPAGGASKGDSTSESDKKQRLTDTDGGATSKDGKEKDKKSGIRQLVAKWLAEKEFQPLPHPFGPSVHYLSTMKPDLPIVIHEEEPSSIIAFMLSSDEYERQLASLQTLLSTTKASKDHATGMPVVELGADAVNLLDPETEEDLCVQASTSSKLEQSQQSAANIQTTSGGGWRALFLRSSTSNAPTPAVTPPTSTDDSRRGAAPTGSSSSTSVSSSSSGHRRTGSGGYSSVTSDATGITSGGANRSEAESSRDETDGVDHKANPDKLHITCEFADTTSEFYCRAYFAEQFRQLRSRIFPAGEERYVRQLSHCVFWAARGGKSGSRFCKTTDDRFILKQMSRPEMQSFTQFAPHYFKFMNNSFDSQKSTVLAKIVGVYRIGFRNKVTNTSLRQDMLIMENLFYNRKTVKIFDLKGSVRSRYVPSSSQSDVLLDENLLEFIYDSPLFLRPHSKLLLSRSIMRDTVFLSEHSIMDYSLLVGIDEANSELVVGIIDFIRTFTWDKRLEMWVKASGLLGGHGKLPTVVAPELYCKRFCEAMDRYFLMVPDKWHGLGVDLEEKLETDETTASSK